MKAPQFINAVNQQRRSELVEKSMSWAYRVRRRVATGLAVVVALSLGYYVVAGQNGLHTYEVKRHEHQQLQKQIDAVQQQNSQMTQQIHALQSDPDTIERVARERLHYARPDEIIVTIPQTQQSGK